LGEESASFEIDPVGKMKTVSLSDELGSALKNTVRSTTRQSPYLTLPSEAVALGFIWKERKQVPMVGATRPIVSDSTYTLERIEERDGEKIAVIQSETTIGVKSLPIDSSSPTQEGHSVVIRYLLKEYKTHGTGTIEFNIDRGQIVHFKTVQQAIRHNVGSTEINKASFEGDVIQKFTQTNEGTYSTTPPTESSDEASSEK